ncbi:probable tubulin polyglutamylase ttll-15 [Ornithodoros turicata]|uniref:probable tubulin polyglutamylase ttll-15 n=1 Tax=Ornithodoros turicata TaxID=34597 RepID=UPI00313918AA
MQNILRHRKQTVAQGAGMKHNEQKSSSDRLPEVFNVQFPRTVYYISSVILVGLLLILVGVLELRKLTLNHQLILQSSLWNSGAASHENQSCDSRPVVWVRGKNIESGYLKHVIAVFEQLGYRVGDKTDDWSVLWSHEYPFVDLPHEMTHLKPHQRVNHFPGSGYITNKVSLSTGSNSEHVPKAFKLPTQKEDFLSEAQGHPSKLWVQKSNHHRGIRVKSLKDLSLDQNGTFVQEFITNPLLIDGKKFDIGVYTVMTSLNPLRVYTYSGDVLLRFCSRPYNDPFDPEDVDSYVVGDDYTPVWQMPSLKNFYVNGSLSMKESLSLYLRKSKKDEKKMWTEIENAIADVYFEKERDMINAASKYKASGGTGHFFELVRFDFVVDEHLRVFLMEANMSPNLSSAHFSQNRILYEQVVYNVLSVIGLGNRATKGTKDHHDSVVSDKNIMVFPDACFAHTCQKCASDVRCKLCQKCLTRTQKQTLKDTFVEHLNRGDLTRIIPAMNKGALSPANELLWTWFEGKCQLDPHFCA